MCQIIVINRGEKEITNPRQFIDHFGFMPITNDCCELLEYEFCLCPCNLDKTFIDNGILFKKDCGDYYVGQLELVKGDDD